MRELDIRDIMVNSHIFVSVKRRNFALDICIRVKELAVACGIRNLKDQDK